MSGPGSDASPLLTASEQAASLRHDLANPISLIIGYSELLAAEASEQGSNAVVAPLGSIRRLALATLTRIDRVLLGHSSAISAAALRRLGEDLLGPALLIVQEVDALLRLVAVAEPAGPLIDDLDRVRTAGAQLVVLIEALETSAIGDA